MQEIKYSIVIPVYNSGDWLDELIGQIQEVMGKEKESYEIVLVNDGSPKRDTWPIMQSLCLKWKYLKAVNLQYNSGQLNALICGLEQADGDYIITMDDDFQHSPYEIPKLIQKMKEKDCDCVIANYAHKEHSFIRKAGSKLANALSEKIYHKPKGITSNSFRLMKRNLAKALVQYKGKKPQIGPMIFTLTRDIDVVVVEHRERAYGKSGYSMKSLIRETFNIILNGSTAIIDAMSVLGSLVSLLSFLIAINYFVMYLLGGIQVPGFTALILVITFFSGIQLLCIGIVGKYIGRIVQETVGFPAYMVREICESKKVQEGAD